jgi:hypothetical protein
MNLHYLNARTLSPKAVELIEFDVDSIRQVIAGQHGAEPETWIVDPDQYEKDGRVLRDSPTYRLLAYAADTRTLYASDGCNACSRHVADLRDVPDVPTPMLERLVALVTFL